MKAKILITLKSFDKIQLPNISRFALNQEISGPEGAEGVFSILKSPRDKSFVIQSSDSLQSSFRHLTMPISSIALPKKQTIFTVLRSPHIDKKSRDQFEYKIYKQLITIETEINQIREKLYNLKFHEIPGVQMKVVFQTKTRLRLKKAPKAPQG
jgi:small subunit ribosomal protein S10